MKVKCKSGLKCDRKIIILKHDEDERKISGHQLAMPHLGYSFMKLRRHRVRVLSSFPIKRLAQALVILRNPHSLKRSSKKCRRRYRWYRGPCLLLRGSTNYISLFRGLCLKRDWCHREFIYIVEQPTSTSSLYSSSIINKICGDLVYQQHSWAEHPWYWHTVPTTAHQKRMQKWQN